MRSKTDIGIALVAVFLLIGLGATIVAAIVIVGWWFLIAVPIWIGLALIWWDALTEWL